MKVGSPMYNACKQAEEEAAKRRVAEDPDAFYIASKRAADLAEFAEWTAELKMKEKIEQAQKARQLANSATAAYQQELEKVAAAEKKQADIDAEAAAVELKRAECIKTHRSYSASIDEKKSKLTNITTSLAAINDNHTACYNVLQETDAIIKCYTEKYNECVKQSTAAADKHIQNYYMNLYASGFHQNGLRQLAHKRTAVAHDLSIFDSQLAGITSEQQRLSNQIAETSDQLRLVDEELKQLIATVRNIEEMKTATNAAYHCAVNTAPLHEAGAIRLHDEAARLHDEAARLHDEAAEAIRLYTSAAEAFQAAQMQVEVARQQSEAEAARQQSEAEAARQQSEAEAEAARQRAEAETARQCAETVRNVLDDIVQKVLAEALQRAEAEAAALQRAKIKTHPDNVMREFLKEARAIIQEAAKEKEAQAAKEKEAQAAKTAHESVTVGDVIVEDDIPDVPDVPPTADKLPVQPPSDESDYKEIDTDAGCRSQQPPPAQPPTQPPAQPSKMVSSPYTPQDSRAMVSSPYTSQVSRAMVSSPYTSRNSRAVSLKQKLRRESPLVPYLNKFIATFKTEVLDYKRFTVDIETLIDMGNQSNANFDRINEHWDAIMGNPKFKEQYDSVISAISDIFKTKHPIPLDIFSDGTFRPTVAILLGYVVACETLEPVTVSDDTQESNGMALVVMSKTRQPLHALQASHAQLMPFSHQGSQTSQLMPFSHQGSQTSQLMPFSHQGSQTSQLMPFSHQGSQTSQLMPFSHQGSQTTQSKILNSLMVKPSRDDSLRNPSSGHRTGVKLHAIKGGPYTSSVPESWLEKIRTLFSLDSIDDAALFLSTHNKHTCTPELYAVLTSLLAKSQNTLELGMFKPSVRESILALQKVLQQTRSCGGRLPAFIPFNVHCSDLRWNSRLMSQVYLKFLDNPDKSLPDFMYHYISWKHIIRDLDLFNDQLRKILTKLQSFLDAGRAGQAAAEVRASINRELQSVMDLPEGRVPVLRCLLTGDMVNAIIKASMLAQPILQKGPNELDVTYCWLCRNGKYKQDSSYFLVLPNEYVVSRKKNTEESNKLRPDSAVEYTLVTHVNTAPPPCLGVHALLESLHCGIPVPSSCFAPDTRRMIIKVLLWIGSNSNFFDGLKWLSAFNGGLVHLTDIKLTQNGVEYPPADKTPSIVVRHESVLQKVYDENKKECTFVGDLNDRRELLIGTEKEYITTLGDLYGKLDVPVIINSPSVRLEDKLDAFKRRQQEDGRLIEEQREFQKFQEERKLQDQNERKQKGTTVVCLPCHCSIHLYNGNVKPKQAVQCRLTNEEHITYVISRVCIDNRVELSCGCLFTTEGTMFFTQNAACSRGEQSHAYDLFTRIAGVECDNFTDPVSIPFDLACGCSAKQHEVCPDDIYVQKCTRAHVDPDHLAELTTLVERLAPQKTDKLPLPCGCTAEFKGGKYVYVKDRRCTASWYNEQKAHEEKVLRIALGVLPVDSAASPAPAPTAAPAPTVAAPASAASVHVEPSALSTASAVFTGALSVASPTVPNDGAVPSIAKPAPAELLAPAPPAASVRVEPSAAPSTVEPSDPADASVAAADASVAAAAAAALSAAKTEADVQAFRQAYAEAEETAQAARRQAIAEAEAALQLSVVGTLVSSVLSKVAHEVAAHQHAAANFCGCTAKLDSGRWKYRWHPACTIRDGKPKSAHAAHERAVVIAAKEQYTADNPKAAEAAEAAARDQGKKATAAAASNQTEPAAVWCKKKPLKWP